MSDLTHSNLFAAPTEATQGHVEKDKFDDIISRPTFDAFLLEFSDGHSTIIINALAVFKNIPQTLLVIFVIILEITIC